MGYFLFKIISNVLTGRLAIVVSAIIFKNQFGFIKGRHIEDCIVIASGYVNNLDMGGNMALKIDIIKAFDTFDWNFLFDVLRKFGFS